MAWSTACSSPTGRVTKQRVVQKQGLTSSAERRNASNTLRSSIVMTGPTSPPNVNTSSPGISPSANPRRSEVVAVKQIVGGQPPGNGGEIAHDHLVEQHGGHRRFGVNSEAGESAGHTD